MTASETGRIVSKPVFRKYREARRVYLDWSSGDGIAHAGEAVSAPARSPFSALLRALPPDSEQVFICGERPGGSGGVFAWLREPALWREWRDAGIHRDPERFVLRLEHRRSGRRVTVYSVSPWFGESSVRPREAREAFAALGELLASKFRGARVLPTPALTGLDLWDRRVSGSEYPVLPDELLRLIRSTSGQGRVELCPAAGLEEIPGFYYLDARWAYSAFIRRMPVGEPRADEVPEHDPYRPGRYRIRFRVPAKWGHVGIFPVPSPEVDPFSGDKLWHYPAEPGTSWETWADHSELLLAERFGWSYEILERVLFDLPDRKGETPPEPLRAWRDKLAELRADADAAPGRGELSPELARLVSGAIRNVFLQGIGSFHRSGRVVWHVVGKDELGRVPPELEPTLEEWGPGLRTYQSWEPLSAEQKKHAHPEWSSTIWAKTRARMLQSSKFQAGAKTGALTLAREDVLAIRTDALYLARDPGWPETGKAGELRTKGAIREPVRAPRTEGELNELRDRAEHELLTAQRPER